MTKYDEAWVKAEEEKRLYMDQNSLYRSEDEHASCGVGLVVAINGKPSRKVVENGIDALKARLALMAAMASDRVDLLRTWAARYEAFSTAISGRGCHGDTTRKGPKSG